MARLRDVDPGYAAPRALTAQLSLPSQRYPSPASARRFLEAVLEGVGAVPGVEAVGATSWLPLSGLHGDWGVRIAGREEERLPSGRRLWADLVVVTDGYFHALGARLEGGRLLTPGDDSSGAPVVMVNGTMARAYWGSAGAVGQRFRLSTDVDGGVYPAVVGVVADIKQAGLDGEPRPTMYLPGAQFPAGTGGPIATVSLVVRSRGDPDGLVRPVRAVVARVDPEVPVSGVATLEELRRESTSVRRFAAGLFDAFALAALLLVAVGVYGAVAYSVGLRRQELAMRLALGSTPAGIVRLVLSDGARLAAVGIVIGVAGAAAIGRLVRSLLFGIGPLDAATFAAAAAVVAGTTGIACWLPARRAMKVDPVQALRSE
jgi:predicted permease